MRCVSHLAVAIVVYLSALTLSAQGPTDTLDIYWIDVEGGAGGHADRDAGAGVSPDGRGVGAV